MSEIAFFNIKDGFPEAIARGMKQALLTPDDYKKLGMAETLEDLRSALEDTDYGSFLQDEPTPLAVTTIAVKAREKLADDFTFLRAQANYPLIKFLDFIVAEKMIDNVISLIQGALNKKSPEVLLARADPLGWSPEMKGLLSIDLSAGYDELYRTVLIDAPVGKYFEAFLRDTASAGSGRSLAEVGTTFTELDLEIVRAALKKSWLEDFYDFVCKLGGTTAEVMSHILKKMADFLVLSVTMNSLNTSMGDSSQLADRNSLYPSFGYLYPEGTDRMRKAFSDQTVRAALECYPTYLDLYEQCKGFYIRETEENDAVTRDVGVPGAARGKDMELKSLEDYLYVEEVKLMEMAFEQQMNYGVFYAWLKLKEQEIRNLTWIADMILMHRKEHLDQILPIFAPRY